MKAPPFEYVRPTRLQDAIGFLAEHGADAKVLAGGQSLVPMLAFRVASPRFLVDIGCIPGLNRITIDNDGIRLGALVRWRDIERSVELQRAHPLLVEAIRHVAHYQIRIAARSAEASRMPTRRQKCRASQSPARRRSSLRDRVVSEQFRRPSCLPARFPRRWNQMS